MRKRQVRVVLGVTGSIAAYKAAELVRLMVGRGWDVTVIMTRSATRLVAPLTFQTLSRNPVCVEMFEQDGEWKPEHIALAGKGDVLIVAPCTANMIGKLANGIADDLLSCVGMAAACPLLLAPAMNERMWDHPATRANVKTLRERGVKILDVGEGDLACGYSGRGRMMDPEKIVEAAAGMAGR